MVTSPTSTATTLRVRPIPEATHLDFLRGRESASFLQTPAWGRVKSEWARESLGWFAPGGDTENERLVGVGLVLYRQLPRLRRYLAYLPEGPVIDWHTDDLAAWLEPMTAHLKRAGAFGVRMGPPVVTRRWTAQQVKDGIADDDVRRLGELPPAERSREGAAVVSQLRELGWRAQSAEGGFAAGQPQYNFLLPLCHAEEDRALTEDELLKQMNQQWRRNIKKAAKEGVVVSRRDGSSLTSSGRAAGSTDDSADLEAFHALYVHTAERDGFTPRPLSYFSTMVEALAAEEPDRIGLWLAHHEGDLVAATIGIRVGTHAWYSYGASSTEKREVRGSNAAQWQMMRDALAAGAEVYDLRGITETLDPDDPHVGLVRFKVGTGGEAVEYAGEWDLPLNRVLYRAFALYMSRRG